MKRFLTVLFISTSLASCATLSKKECLNADWTTIGYEDSAQGYRSDRISSHRRACAEHGVIPDLNAYRKGYSDGLLTFCTPANGFNKGKIGQQYKGICPPDLEQDFLKGYRDGKKINTARNELQKIEDNLNRVSDEIENISSKIHRKEKKLFSADISKKERKELYNRISALKDDRKDLEIEKELLIREQYDAEDRLDYIEERFRYSY